MGNSSKPAGRTIIAAALALAAAVVILGAVFFLNTAKPAGGEKNIAVRVVHGDGSTKDFPVKTTEEYLGPALVAEGIVEDNQSTYGLYILTADGETADEGGQEWWKITKSGEMLNTAADKTPLAEGDAFELIFTVGYDG